MANTASGASALTFTFSTTQDLRVIMIDGDPWYVAADVADILEYAHVPSMVRMCDDDEKGVQIVHTLGGDQKMTVLSQPGLFRVITNSRSERTKPFQRKLFHEILPAINKTGRYVAPSAEPRAAESETITANDLTHIKRVIWMIVDHFRFSSAWNQGVWYHLRLVLGLPSPAPLTVEHLPIVARELSRMVSVSDQVAAVVRDIETEALRRIVRKGESADLVLADIRRQAHARMERIDAESTKLPDWLRQDIAAITARTRAAPLQYLADEQPGYFDQVSKESNV